MSDTPGFMGTVGPGGNSGAAPLHQVGLPGSGQPGPGPGLGMLSAATQQAGPGGLQSGVDRDPQGRGEVIPRDPPEVPPARRELVDRWVADILEARDHWSEQFEQMRDNTRFAQGRQWPSDVAVSRHVFGARDDRYVANVALRHVQARTAALYASNPTVTFERRERMLLTVWDGELPSVIQAQATVEQASAVGQLAPPQALAIMQDFVNYQQVTTMLDKVGNTLKLLYELNVDEQPHAFKQMMKLTIRRAIVTSVGWVKLGFQRALRRVPEIEQRISDMTERLSVIEQLTADLSDDVITITDPEAEQLRLDIQALMSEPQIIVREGLTFDYPDSWAIIPDKRCKHLATFLGCEWVAQEFMLSVDEIEQIYQVDVRSSYNSWNDDGQRTEKYESAQASSNMHTKPGGVLGERKSGAKAMVFEVYSRKHGVVLTVCDGYPDFLVEPGPPDIALTQFYPWFAVVLNESYDDHTPYPPSDIDLIRDPQLEINRARQGLREQRVANRPKIAVAAGLLEDEDKDKLRNHPANALLELNALAPGQKVEDVLQGVKMPAIDPALYDTNPAMEDMLRVLGSQPADLGTPDNRDTATQSAFAEQSHHTEQSSVIDDLDTMLTALANAGGQVLLANVSQQTVIQLLGPGAAWPTVSPEDIAKNVYLKIQAGSTGRPNKQAEVQNMAILIPLLQRVPGISPKWLAEQVIKRLDDRIDITDAYVEGLPSMEAMNRVAPGAGGAPGGPPGGPGASPGPRGRGSRGGGSKAPQGPGGGPAGPGLNDPSAQGPAGARNAPGGPPTSGLTMPRNVAGMAGNLPQQRGGGPGGNGMQPKGASMWGMPTP